MSPADGVRPIDYPPPFAAGDVIGPPTDDPDERIEVGVLIVGGGPAGLACAIRLGQLLEERPELAERLGDVPVALVDKGKQPGSHLLSGAVVDPRSLRKLFRGKYAIEDLPSYGAIHGEAVYLLTKGRALRIPPPPTMRNHGNWIFSLSQLGRFLSEEAEALGVTILPETAAERLLVDHGRVVGIRTGDKGQGREGEPLGNYEPGADVTARLTVLAEGTAGHLTLAALDRFGLESEQPQLWELGVKEVWRVAKPLDHIIHTMGWPLRKSAKWREFGGSFVYPMGDEHVSLGFVAGLDYSDVELSVHDLLQELKTHRLLRTLLEGGERVAWGAKTITSGGYQSLPRAFHAPGLVLAGESAGLVNIPRLKGVHYAVESGHPRSRSDRRGARTRRGPHAARRARRVRRVPPDELPDAGAPRGAEHATGVRQGLLRRWRAREPDDRDEGEPAPEGVPLRTAGGDAAAAFGPVGKLPGAGREAHLRQAVLCFLIRQQNA